MIGIEPAPTHIGGTVRIYLGTGTRCGQNDRSEMKLAISFAILAAANSDSTPEPVLRPPEQAMLNCLQAAREPLPARTVAGVSGVSGVPAATTAEALASLHAKGLITRRRKGRAWL